MSRVAEQRCSVSCCAVMLCAVLCREPVAVAVVVGSCRCCFFAVGLLRCDAMQCAECSGCVEMRLPHETRF
jgi:hypothetical protein